MKTIICGGRDIDDREALDAALIACPWAVTHVFSGEAKGVDTMGRDWALSRGLGVSRFPADWGKYGPRAAGVVRNTAMLDAGAEAVVAFWDGVSSGTSDMIDQARRRGIPVHVVTYVHRDRPAVTAYCASSRDVKLMKSEKESLRAAGYPKEEVRRLLERHFRLDSYQHLAGRQLAFFVAPSTTRTNTIPFELACLLRKHFGGVIVTGWAQSMNRLKAANKGGIGKLRDPVRLVSTGRCLDFVRGRSAVIVDDVITTGETTDACKAVLAGSGIVAATVAALGQAEVRRVSVRDLERITQKLGDPPLAAEVARVLSGALKHRANYIERIINDRTRAEIRRFFNDNGSIGNTSSHVQPKTRPTM